MFGEGSIARLTAKIKGFADVAGLKMLAKTQI
jgi:hypothetical protein